MQVDFTRSSYYKAPTFTAITADRTGRALLVQRMKQVRNEATDWEELVKLIENHKNNQNSIFITGGNGDGGIGVVIENRVSGAKTRIAEGPLKIETPLEVIKKAISIGEEFSEKMRPPLGLKARVKEILNML